MTFAHIVDGRRAALAAARAVHRRRPGHEDRARGMSLAELAGARARLRDPDLRAQPGRVRARRGRPPVGRRRQRVPRLPRRDLGAQRRPLPPARRRGGPRAGRRGSSHVSQPLLHRAGDAAGGAAGRRARWAARCSSATRAPRPTRRRSSSSAGARRAGDIVVVHGAFHGRTYGALSATPQESKQAPFAPLVPGFAVVADGPGRAAPRPSTTTPRRCCSSRSRARPASTCCPTSCCCAAREACDRAGRGAGLRRDPDRDGADRHAVGLRADRRRARRDDGRQGARRRAADRRAGHRRRAWPTCFAPGDHGSTFAGGPVRARPRAGACSTCSTTTRCSPACASWASGCATGSRELPGVTAVRGRGLMVAFDVDGDAPGARAPRAARAAAGRQRHRPGHAAPRCRR